MNACTYAYHTRSYLNSEEASGVILPSEVGRDQKVCVLAFGSAQVGVCVRYGLSLDPKNYHGNQLG